MIEAQHPVVGLHEWRPGVPAHDTRRPPADWPSNRVVKLQRPLDLANLLADVQLDSVKGEAVFSNAFSDEHQELVRQFSGVSGEMSLEDVMVRAFATVRELVAQLEAQGKADFSLYPKKDGRLIQSVLLYDTYGRFIKDFDQLIQKQISSGDTPCPVPFAKDALALLSRRGFIAAEARRFFAFFYQFPR